MLRTAARRFFLWPPRLVATAGVCHGKRLACVRPVIVFMSQAAIYNRIIGGNLPRAVHGDGGEATDTPGLADDEGRPTNASAGSALPGAVRHDDPALRRRCGGAAAPSRAADLLPADILDSATRGMNFRDWQMANRQGKSNARYFMDRYREHQKVTIVERR